MHEIHIVNFDQSMLRIFFLTALLSFSGVTPRDGDSAFLASVF
jgi:hypothetical protein